MTCDNINHADAIIELIVTEEAADGAIKPFCRLPVNGTYSIWFFESSLLPVLSMDRYSYASIPVCYGLLDSSALEVSGITRLQNLSTLSLSGSGVMLAVIDTGINYEDAAFRNADGSSRIHAMWDQTAAPAYGEDCQVIARPSAPGEVCVPYGREYSRAEINAALAAEDPQALVPETDANGHGTYLASIAAASPDPANDFSGAAPEAELVIVKLRPARPYLKEFYFIPENKDVYAETDIMTAIAYADELARQEQKPLVILLGLGSNNGSHAGTEPLCEYLNSIGVQRNRAIVNAAGNEALQRHHFLGRAESLLVPARVEINVEQRMSGFYTELWALAPEWFSVEVRSPTGEVMHRVNPIAGARQSIRFVFEETELTVDYQDAGRSRRDQLIFFRFTNAAPGLWTILVYPEYAIEGNFHLWLPMQGMLESDVYFLTPNPDTTVTTPGDAPVPMTVGGYQALTDVLYQDSGRGYNTDGTVKPDFLAPAVGVTGKGLRGQYITASGTSAAAAITAGAAALFMEWAVVMGNEPGINSIDIRNLFTRGARRDPDRSYPSRECGYGMLDVYGAFLTLRQT